MIRESIARHLSQAPATMAPAAPSGRIHASHVLLPFLQSGDDQGACLIEPTVRCSHCGYCLSYGH